MRKQSDDELQDRKEVVMVLQRRQCEFQHMGRSKLRCASTGMILV